MKLMRFLVGPVMGALLACTACATVVIGDSSVSYDDMCTPQRTKCRADGNFAIMLERDRPAFMHLDPAEYLGSLVAVSNVRDLRDACLRPTENDYSVVFERPLKVTLLKTQEVEAQVEAAVNASLPVGLQKPEVKGALKGTIRQTLEENAYTHAVYRVYTLTDEFIRSVRDATQGSQLQCKEKLQHARGTRAFVWSIAVITSDGKLNKVQTQQVQAAISAKLDELAVSIGSVDATVKAQIAASIVNSVETNLDAQVKEHATIYSYGMWKGFQPADDPLQMLMAAENVQAIKGRTGD